MATIKSYSDLQQSKKLAEFLPLESADMFFICVGNREIIRINDNIKDYNHWDTYPAWSLAALLEVLKNKIVYGGNDSENWFVSYTKKNPTKTIFIYKENLIDACYEAILNLNKEELL